MKGIVFDLDGVLYCGDKAIDGAESTVDNLVWSDYQVLFLTNNSGKTRQQVVNKLKRLGFSSAKPINTYCASYAILQYLLEKGIRTIYLIGGDSLRDELLKNGIEIKDSSQVQAVVVGLDFDFGHKIPIALEAIVKNGAKLIVANLDPWYPAGNGRILPGCGAMVGAVVGATRHEPDFVVGKPNAYMLQLICKEYKFSPEEICVVGDMPDSDIQMARNFGCESILFDPENAFPEFLGRKVRWLSDIASLLTEKGD